MKLLKELKFFLCVQENILQITNFKIIWMK